MTDKSSLGLNIRAMQALRGASLDWRSDILALLDSTAPIDDMFRQELARAIRNRSEHGPRLDLRGVDAERRRYDSIAARFEWMRVGYWIKARLAEGIKHEEALWRAAEHFGKSEGYCKKVWKYFKRASVWIEGALQSEQGSALGAEMLESIYHQLQFEPGARAFARMNEKLLGALGIQHSSAVGGSRE